MLQVNLPQYLPRATQASMAATLVIGALHCSTHCQLVLQDYRYNCIAGCPARQRLSGQTTARKTSLKLAAARQRAAARLVVQTLPIAALQLNAAAWLYSAKEGCCVLSAEHIQMSLYRHCRPGLLMSLCPPYTLYTPCSSPCRHEVLAQLTHATQPCDTHWWALLTTTCCLAGFDIPCNLQRDVTCLAMLRLAVWACIAVPGPALLRTCLDTAAGALYRPTQPKQVGAPG
jgi:hypothetical protein